MVAVICNVAVLTMPTEWIAAALVLGFALACSRRVRHWLKRHLTADGRALGQRLRAIEGR